MRGSRETELGSRNPRPVSVPFTYRPPGLAGEGLAEGSPGVWVTLSDHRAQGLPFPSALTH